MAAEQSMAAGCFLQVRLLLPTLGSGQGTNTALSGLFCKKAKAVFAALPDFHKLQA